MTRSPVLLGVDVTTRCGYRKLIEGLGRFCIFSRINVWMLQLI